LTHFSITMVSTVLLLPLLIAGLFLFWKRKTIRDFLVFRRKAMIAMQDIPGPSTLPLVGAAYQFKPNPADFGDQVADFMRIYCLEHEKRCGMMQMWIGPMPMLFVQDPDIAKEILESNTLITKSHDYDLVSEWIGTGLLISTNEKWYARRKMLTPAFHFNVLKGYNEVFVRQGQVLLDTLEKHADTGREFDVFPFIKRCALDIICETAMGTNINSQIGGNSEYVDAVVRVSDLIFSYMRFPWLWLKPVWYGSGMGFEFDRLVKLTNDFTRNVINERRQNLIDEGAMNEEMTEEEMKNKKLVFLDLMLMKQKSAGLSDEDIREEVDTFMFEGHDTTASGMAFCVWYLGQHPEYQALVHDELDEIFGDSDREPAEADLKKLNYLERCIKEALRLRPSVPLLARRLTHDVILGGFTMPENMTVVVCPMATHRSPKHWERPEEFYPDHFTQESMSKRHPYAYFPFSAGPRNCIGQKFAMSEEKTVLSWFFRRYRVESVVPYPGNRPVPELILKPSDGVRVRMYKRRAD
ncbi:hypothetical protein PFISCL1PPCAC_2603, partial [Pristionchus fissidentatus]